MDPVTLTAVSLGTTAASTGIGAFGSMLSGSANAASYRYQAGLAGINAKIARQNADYSRAVGEVEAQREGMKTRFNIGQTKVAQATSGVNINSGSSAAVRESEGEIGRYDQSVIRSNAAKRAYGYEVEAATQTAQQGVFGSAAKQSETGGMLGALSSILGGASSVSSKWLQAKQYGIFGDQEGFYGGSPDNNPLLRLF